MLGWLVDRKIAPHIPVIDWADRSNGARTHADFEWGLSNLLSVNSVWRASSIRVFHCDVASVCCDPLLVYLDKDGGGEAF